jgi:hypothetical protein
MPDPIDTAIAELEAVGVNPAAPAAVQQLAKAQATGFKGLLEKITGLFKAKEAEPDKEGDEEEDGEESDSDIEEPSGDGPASPEDQQPGAEDMAKGYADVTEFIQGMANEQASLRQQVETLTKAVNGLVDRVETLTKATGDGFTAIVGQSAELSKAVTSFGAQAAQTPAAAYTPPVDVATVAGRHGTPPNAGPALSLVVLAKAAQQRMFTDDEYRRYKTERRFSLDEARETAIRTKLATLA